MDEKGEIGVNPSQWNSEQFVKSLVWSKATGTYPISVPDSISMANFETDFDRLHGISHLGGRFQEVAITYMANIQSGELRTSDPVTCGLSNFTEGNRETKDGYDVFEKPAMLFHSHPKRERSQIGFSKKDLSTFRQSGLMALGVLTGNEIVLGIKTSPDNFAIYHGQRGKPLEKIGEALTI